MICISQTGGDWIGSTRFVDCAERRRHRHDDGWVDGPGSSTRPAGCSHLGRTAAHRRRLRIGYRLQCRFISWAAANTPPAPDAALALGRGPGGVVLATDGLRWLEPTHSFWIGMFVMITIGFHKGFVWLWHQLADRWGKNQT